MNIEIERGFNGSYLIIKDEAIDTADDELCMFLNNHITGFVKAACRTVNGIECIYYNVSSMVSLADIAKKQEFKFKEIKEIIESLITAEASLEDYLLTDNGIIMNPEFVFYDTHERKIKFCFYPFYNKDIFESLNELSEFMLRSTDHSDKKAVKLVYKFYSQIQNSDYDFRMLLKCAQENPVSTMTGRLHQHITTQISRANNNVRSSPVYKPYKPNSVSRLPMVFLILLMAVVFTAMLVLSVVYLDL